MKQHKGIHHITAIAGDPQVNLKFYTDVLGMRLVKKTVNFDDPSVYHLYYGDETGTPGSILTFFPWTYAKQGQPGVGQAVAVSFAVPPGSFDFWIEHLSANDIDFESPFERFDNNVLGLQDPDGLHLELIESPSATDMDGWSNGIIPAGKAVRGFYGVTLAEEDFTATGELLTGNLGFEQTGREHDRYQYRSDAPIGSTVEVIHQSELRGRPGKGTVHHVAFRAENDNEQQQMRKKLLDRGYFITEVKDRRYFRSVYFHEPGGVLFEIATDPPGFLKDEPVEGLGSELKLPPWLEDRRKGIEDRLPVLQ